MIIEEAQPRECGTNLLAKRVWAAYTLLELSAEVNGPSVSWSIRVVLSGVRGLNNPHEWHKRKREDKEGNNSETHLRPSRACLRMDRILSSSMPAVNLYRMQSDIEPACIRRRAM